MTIREFYTLVGGSYDDMSERFPSDALILRFLTMLPQDGSTVSYTHLTLPTT